MKLWITIYLYLLKNELILQSIKYTVDKGKINIQADYFNLNLVTY